MGVHAVSTAIAALVVQPLVFGICITFSGACWMMVNANNSTAVQMILPNFMRARGMAVHQMVFLGPWSRARCSGERSPTYRMYAWR